MDALDALLQGRQNATLTQAERSEAEARALAADAPVYAPLVLGVQGTFAGALIRDALRTEGRTVDPTWNPADNMQDFSDLPSSYHGLLMETVSREDAERVRTQFREDAERGQMLSGGSALGMAGYLLGGIADVDLPLAVLSDGVWTAAKVGRVVKNARAASAIGTGLTAGATEAALTAARTGFDPTVTWEDVPGAALGGMLLGGAFGAAFPMQARLADVAGDMRNGIEARMRAGEDWSVAPHELNPADNLPAFTERLARPGEDSAGAARVRTRPALNPDVHFSAEEEAFIEHARQWNTQQYLYGDVDVFAVADDAASTQQPRFKQGLAKFEKLTGQFLTDYGRMANSNSPGQLFVAHRLLESPTGRSGRTVTAALDREMMLRQMSEGMPAYDTAYDMWARTQQARATSVIDDAKNWYARRWSDAMRHDFDRAVYIEMNARRNGRSTGITGPVKDAADALEMQSKRAFDLQKDAGVGGFDKLEYKPGYLPQIANGAAMMRMLNSGVPREKIENALTAAYMQGYGMTKDRASVLTGALVNRALARTETIDTSVYSLLSADGRDFLIESLVLNGQTRDEANRLVSILSDEWVEKGRLGHTKARNELDMSLTVDGVQVADLFVTNTTELWTRYARQASGAAALAKAGLPDRAAIAVAKSAIMRERAALGEQISQKDRDFLDGVFSYFTGDPIDGGVNEYVTAIQRATNLSLLNKLGLAQAGELGAIIGAVGIEQAISASPMLRKLVQAVGGKTGDTNVQQILEDLAPATGRMWDDHLLFNPAIDYSSERLTVLEQEDLIARVNTALSKGLRVQGYVSGFYKIREMELKFAAVSMADKILRTVRDNGALSERLQDVGVTPSMVRKLKDEIQAGNVQFTQKGYTDRLNMQKWSPELQREFAAAITRHSRQVVQDAMIGEGSVWMHKSFGSLLTQLKKFPLLALQKQTLRNVRLADAGAVSTFAYGLATAGAVYVVRQIIDGNTERLTAEDIAYGAMNMSNMTGSVLMGTDAIGTIFGIEGLQSGVYARPGAGMTPPALEWADKVRRLPGLVTAPVTGYDYADWQALKALPFANAYGVSLLLNSARPQ